MSALLDLLLGVSAVVALTAVTGYFVAQEFSYLAVDRSRLTADVATGDRGAARVLGITGRTSFLLSGAQLGITVTGLLAGYLAEPLIGASIGTLLDGTGIPLEVGVAAGTAVALLFATVVQMVLGELLPKNLAIARPGAVARALARSTQVYLAVFGPVIRVFDRCSALLLRALRIEPVHDVEHAASAHDLGHIVAESRRSGELPDELGLLLERMLEFDERTAAHAMVPRPRVRTARRDEPVAAVLRRMATGPSRLPVLGEHPDEVVGVVGLRELLAAADPDGPVGGLARPPLLVPGSLPLTRVLDTLRARPGRLACVVDEFGGLAGVLTVEDLAEELVGEIRHEYDADGDADVDARRTEDGWLVDGSMPLDELRRLLGHRLPAGPHRTVSGLVISGLGRLPAVGDTVELPAEPDGVTSLRVLALRRRVPSSVRISVRPR